MKHTKHLLVLWAALLLGAGNVVGKEYTLTIQTSDFNATSYAANNKDKKTTATATDGSGSTLDVTWYSNQIMLQGSVMQWQKNNGYIYNKTDLGTIKSVNITSSAGTFTTYYGTSQNPTSGTTVGNGFFTIKIGSAIGKTTKIVVTFEIAGSISTTLYLGLFLAAFVAVRACVRRVECLYATFHHIIMSKIDFRSVHFAKALFFCFLFISFA